ncbi:TlpA family protein disulfide reductase [Aeropyrum camini]|uniref:TlpA family protein disulfide reductase n=1 Tax=Aeropyrum camini TaxID=229980 RepID=UPI0011E59A2F|nr:redoxin domain-containing protein [Aeropyrum camini]
MEVQRVLAVLPARRIFALAAAMILLVTAGYTAYNIVKTPESNSQPGKAAELGHIDFKTIDGETVSLADVEGRVVILWFMAAWCPSCVYMADVLNSLHDEYDGITIIAVDFWTKESLEVLGLNKPGYPPPDSPEMFRRFVNSYGDPTWILVMDDGTLVKRFDVKSIDYIVIMDRSGNILYTGAAPSLAELESVIKNFLTG